MKGYEIPDEEVIGLRPQMVTVNCNGVHKTCISKRSKPYVIKKCRCGSGLTFNQCCNRKK